MVGGCEVKGSEEIGGEEERNNRSPGGTERDNGVRDGGIWAGWEGKLCGGFSGGGGRRGN